MKRLYSALVVSVVLLTFLQICSSQTSPENPPVYVENYVLLFPPEFMRLPATTLSSHGYGWIPAGSYATQADCEHQRLNMQFQRCDESGCIAILLPDTAQCVTAAAWYQMQSPRPTPSSTPDPSAIPTTSSS